MYAALAMSRLAARARSSVSGAVVHHDFVVEALAFHTPLCQAAGGAGPQRGTSTTSMLP